MGVVVNNDSSRNGANWSEIGQLSRKGSWRGDNRLSLNFEVAYRPVADWSHNRRQLCVSRVRPKTLQCLVISEYRKLNYMPGLSLIEIYTRLPE